MAKKKSPASPEEIPVPGKPEVEPDIGPVEPEIEPDMVPEEEPGETEPPDEIPKPGP